MPERCSAWLTFACLLCVLNVSWCRAADDDEHVHIKVRMPELVRKHKTHKPAQHHHHHNYHHRPHQQHQHHHHYHKPHPHAQYANQATKHARRAVKPTAPAPMPQPPPPPLPQLAAIMPPPSQNNLNIELYGDELSAAGFGGVASGLRGGLPEQLLYSPDAPQPMPLAPDITPNYGPALFGISGGGIGMTGGGNVENNQPPTHSVLTMPGSTQQLMQHMELIGALAAAAAAAGGGGDDGDTDSDDGIAGGGAGGGVSETTNTHLADDFLADMQRTYANGKLPATNSKRKKKYRGGGLAEIGDAAVTFPLNTPQLQQQHVQQQQQQHQQLLRQQYLQQQQRQTQQQQQQQFYGANYLTQQSKPQTQMIRAPATNYHSYHQHMHYKNKQRYNNNDIYATATSEEGIGGESADDGVAGDEDDDDNDDDVNNNNDDENDDAAVYFTKRPRTSSAAAVGGYNNANDYDDIADDELQFGYNSNSNYFVGVDGDANEGVNPVNQSTTAYGAYAASASTPATMTHLKLRPYRQLTQQQQQQQKQKQKHKRKPSGFSVYQQLQLQRPQQQLITTAQPINVVGPTASDFDEQSPPPAAQQHQHKYPLVSPRYKKRKNRIKGKPNRNRIPTQ